MPRGVKNPPPPSEPTPEHVHTLVPHCKANQVCPWVACRTCAFYATKDGTRWAYR